MTQGEKTNFISMYQCPHTAQLYSRQQLNWPITVTVGRIFSNQKCHKVVYLVLNVFNLSGGEAREKFANEIYLYDGGCARGNEILGG